MYLALDFETGSTEFKKRKGSPWANKILCVGLKYQDREPIALAQDYMPDGWLKDVNIILGHNIKFDLLHTWRDKGLQDYLVNGGKIWCTQLAQYILTGQQHKFAALRDIAVNKYNCPERTKKIEEGLKKGINTTDMDIEDLLFDVRNDVLDTESIAIQQVKRAKETGMFKLIQQQMEALLATTEMEYNGMFIDRKIFNSNKEALDVTRDDIKDRLNKQLMDKWHDDTFNISSPRQLAILFFGGQVKTRKQIDTGEVYKTGPNKGKPKLKWEEGIKIIDGFEGLTCRKEWTTDKGNISVDEGVLKTISKMKKINNDIKAIAKMLLEHRGLEKEIGTYYESIGELTYDHDSCIHAQFNHCQTNTGRLSSSNPNIQNIPRSE